MSTKNWLLDRIMREAALHESTKRAYQESQCALEEAEARAQSWEISANERLEEVLKLRAKNRDDSGEVKELKKRIAELSNHKQFTVMLRETGCPTRRLAIDVVRSVDGHTVIETSL